MICSLYVWRCIDVLEWIEFANLGGDGGNSKLSGKTPLILWKLKLVGRRLRGTVAHLSEKEKNWAVAHLSGEEKKQFHFYQKQTFLGAPGKFFMM